MWCKWGIEADYGDEQQQSKDGFLYSTKLGCSSIHPKDLGSNPNLSSKNNYLRLNSIQYRFSPLLEYRFPGRIS